MNEYHKSDKQAIEFNHKVIDEVQRQRDKAEKQRDALLKACEASEEARFNLEKVIAYCNTDDDTIEIGQELTKLVLPKLVKAEALIDSVQKAEVRG